MSKEAMKLALEALEKLNNTKSYWWQEVDKDVAVQLLNAETALREALAEQPAQQEPVGVDFMRQVLSVAIAGLHQHYKDDVLRVFTLDDLQTVVDLSEPLQSQNVEDIYKRAWAMLAAAPQPAQQEPVLQDIEQYRLQMAGISTAAIGYWKESDGIHPDYDTIALRDVAKLYAKYDELYRAQRTWVGLTDALKRAIESMIESHEAGDLDGWEVQLVKRRLHEATNGIKGDT